jgi:hypothetical protein
MYDERWGSWFGGRIGGGMEEAGFPLGFRWVGRVERL